MPLTDSVLASAKDGISKIWSGAGAREEKSELVSGIDINSQVVGTEHTEMIKDRPKDEKLQTEDKKKSQQLNPVMGIKRKRSEQSLGGQLDLQKDSATLDSTRKKHHTLGNLDMDSPTLHPKTSALYIWNLSRPLVIRELSNHIAECAQEVPRTVWFDRVRSHCFAVFSSEFVAQRAREALHNHCFPEEDHSRKPMLVDYVPEGKVSEWIALEEKDGPRSTIRWQVSYKQTLTGDSTAELEKCGGISSSKPANESSKHDNHSSGHALANSTGRKLSNAEASLRESTLRLKLQSSVIRNKPSISSDRLRRTKAKPIIVYSEAPSHLIRERLNQT